jgi:hypothetical protein
LLNAPQGEDLKEFEAKMKKKWDSILEKHPIDLAATTDAPEGLATPTADPEQHILDSLHALDATTAVPTFLAAYDDLKVETTAAPAAPSMDAISAELANLKARLNADTTAAPIALTAPAPESDVKDLLANLHSHIHDVHSSVHDALDGSLSHPAIFPTIESLAAKPHKDEDAPAGDDAADSKLPDIFMAPPAKADGAEDDKSEQSKDSDEDAPAEPHKLSEEQAKAMQGMQKLMGAVKMIVMLEPMLEPLKEKLTLALEHMTAEDADKAKGILKHIKALDVYSKVTAGLMAGVVAAKTGTAEDREKAIATLIVGVKQIQEKVAKHLLEMKRETLLLKPGAEGAEAEGDEGAAPADAEGAGEVHEGGHAKHAEVAMDKMTALLVKLGRKIAQEIKDPANRHNPKVLLDIKLFLAVKDSVEKTQALMMAGSIAIKKAKTSDEKAAVQAAVKKGMGKVEATLKSKMMALEKQALLLAVAAAKQHEQGHAGEDGAEEESDTADEKKADEEEEVQEPKGGKKVDKKKKDDDDDEEVDDDKAAGDDKVDAKKKPKDDEEGAEEEESKEGDEEKPGKKEKKEDGEATEGEDEDGGDEKPDPPKQASAETAAKKNHPEISSTDIEHIFEEAADDATGDSPSSMIQTKDGSHSEEEAHLRTH